MGSKGAKSVEKTDADDETSVQGDEDIYAYHPVFVVYPHSRASARLHPKTTIE